jgi:hypothetical protein
VDVDAGLWQKGRDRPNPGGMFGLCREDCHPDRREDVEVVGRNSPVMAIRNKRHNQWGEQIDRFLQATCEARERKGAQNLESRQFTF